MERYLVEFKTRDNKGNFCFVLAETPLEAKKWAEDNIHVKVFRVSLFDIENKNNGEKNILWELSKNETDTTISSKKSQIQEEEPNSIVLNLKNKYNKKLKDLNALIRAYKKACRIDMNYYNLDDLRSDTEAVNKFTAHKTIIRELVKDLSVAKNEDDIYNIYNKFSDEKNMLDEILIDLKESMHDSNNKSDTKERDE